MTFLRVFVSWLNLAIYYSLLCKSFLFTSSNSLSFLSSSSIFSTLSVEFYFWSRSVSGMVCKICRLFLWLPSLDSWSFWIIFLFTVFFLGIFEVIVTCINCLLNSSVFCFYSCSWFPIKLSSSFALAIRVNMFPLLCIWFRLSFWVEEILWRLFCSSCKAVNSWVRLAS